KGEKLPCVDRVEQATCMSCLRPFVESRSSFRVALLDALPYRRGVPRRSSGNHYASRRRATKPPMVQRPYDLRLYLESVALALVYRDVTGLGVSHVGLGARVHRQDPPAPRDLSRGGQPRALARCSSACDVRRPALTSAARRCRHTSSWQRRGSP